MRKKLLLTVCLGVIPLLLACSTDRTPEKTTYVTPDINQGYSKAVLIADPAVLPSPQGIVCLDGRLYIVSKDLDKICIYDYDGSFLGSIGQTGNGKGEFLSPVSLTTTPDGKLVVVEEGNKRVQVVDTEGNYIADYAIDCFDKFGCYAYDAAVNNEGTIYVSFRPYKVKYAQLLKITADSLSSYFGSELCGCFCTAADKSEVRYIQSFDVLDDGYTTGVSYLAKLEGDNIEAVCNFPEHYSPVAAVEYNGFIIIYNCSKDSLDVFEADGDYITTLYCGDVSETYLGDINYMAVNEDGDIFISTELTDTIYKVEAGDYLNAEQTE